MMLLVLSVCWRMGLVFSVNWKQFKDHLEEQGVTDDTFIDTISYDRRMNMRTDYERKPDVVVYKVGYAFHADMW